MNKRDPDMVFLTVASNEMAHNKSLKRLKGRLTSRHVKFETTWRFCDNGVVQSWLAALGPFDTDAVLSSDTNVAICTRQDFFDGSRKLYAMRDKLVDEQRQTVGNS